MADDGKNGDAKDTDTGRQDGDGKDTEREDDDPEDDDDEGEEDGGYTPPSKEEWAKTQRALRKANAEAKKARLRARGKSSGAASSGDDSDDSGDATRDKATEREKRTAGLLALTSEGVSRDQAKRLVRLLDLDDQELDEFGELDLEDQIADLKDEFPALFAKEDDRGRRSPRPRTSGGRGRDSGEATAPDEKHTQRLLRSAGYR